MADPYADEAMLAAMDVCFEAHGLRHAVLEVKARIAAVLAGAADEPEARDIELVSVLGQLDFVVDVLTDMASAMPPDVAKALTTNDAGASQRVDHPARGIMANIHGALEARERLGQAKGVVMHAAGCDAEAAFRVLQRLARRRGARLNAVVEEVATTGSLGDGLEAVVGTAGDARQPAS